MRLTCNRHTALKILRAIRLGATPVSALENCPRIDAFVPDPSPQKRWTKRLIGLKAFGLSDDVSASNPVYVVTPDRNSRVQARFAVNTMYVNDGALPPRSFIDVGDGIAISCPELLFLEMAPLLRLPELVVLGNELCGSFARNPEDPRNGEGRMDVPPVTTAARIEAFIDEVRWVRGVEQARAALAYVVDNAWSPTESVVAALAMLPAGEFGYQMEGCVLNEKVDASSNLAGFNDKSSRVPDILFGKTKVGINYDGAVHLDLAMVASAAEDAALNPDEPYAQVALREAMRDVRAKAVDDIRRNRELAAAGYIVFPVTKEDLYEDGGLDRVMMQVIEAIEKFSGQVMASQRELMKSRLIRTRRQELIWSLMPGIREVVARKIVWPGRAARQPEAIEMMIGI